MAETISGMGKHGKGSGGNSHQRAVQEANKPPLDSAPVVPIPPSKAEETSPPPRDLFSAGLSFGASLVVGLYFAKALWALPFIGITGYFLSDYVLFFIRKLLSARVQIVGVNLIFAALFTYATWALYLKDEYHKQQAAETEGDLEPLPSDGAEGVTLQVGTDGPKFNRTVPGNIAKLVMPLEKLNQSYDSGLVIEKGKKGLEITTPVIDRDGNRVGEIIANHWKVYPPYCSEKNYNKNSIEMKDKAGHVVLQLTLYENKVQMQGEWHTYMGAGERIISVPGFGGITFWLKPEDEKKNPFLIKPIFVYPSSQHWGELLSKPQ